jgi:hypothetical protein
MRTADATVDGAGRVIGSASADYRSSSGYVGYRVGLARLALRIYSTSTATTMRLWTLLHDPIYVR